MARQLWVLTGHKKLLSDHAVSRSSEFCASWTVRQRVGLDYVEIEEF